MLTALHDTKYFSRQRITISDLAFFEKGAGTTARSPHIGFRRESGFFYVFQDLQDVLVRHLDQKPAVPSSSEFFIWTLKDDSVPYAFLSKEYDGEKNCVPWWVVKPLLRWQQSGSEGGIIPSTGATFFIEAHPTQLEKRQVPVTVRLDCGSLRSEWYLRRAEIEKRTRFQVGDVFFSVV